MREGPNRLMVVVGAIAVVTLLVGCFVLASYYRAEVESMGSEVADLREQLDDLQHDEEDGRQPDEGPDPGSGSDAAPARDGEPLNALDVDGVECDGRGPDHLQGAIDQAADEGRVLLLPATGAACLVDEPLWTDDGTRIQADPDTVIEALPGFSFDNGDSLVNAVGVRDVDISGGRWQMLDEGRDVFRIMSSTNVTLSDLTAAGGGSDGVYIGRSGPSTRPPSDEHPTPEDITVERVMADGNLRLGFAIISGRDIAIVDSKAHNNGAPEGGHNPMRGLHVEPNIPEDVVQNIRVVNLETRGNPRGGAVVGLDKLTNESADVDIVIEGLDSEEEELGFGVSHGHSDSTPAGVGGTVRLVDAKIHRAATHAIFVTNNWVTATRVEIVRPVITEWNTTPSGDDWADGAIIISAINDTPSPIGNVQITEPGITASADAGRYAYYLRAQNEYDPDGVEDVEFLDPVRLEGGRGFDVADGVLVEEEVQTDSTGLLTRFVRFLERLLPFGWS